eukprot:GHVT01029830.1.p1 GENE.GHVT01029830.1~~GHVT01029830.1.p1  ORF type:complete len:294 (+),score=86.15 GHVT01029830.1:635-1516(+)
MARGSPGAATGQSPKNDRGLNAKLSGELLQVATDINAEKSLSVVEDVRSILVNIRRQHDEIHVKCRRRGDELFELKEGLRLVENSNQTRKARLDALGQQKQEIDARMLAADEAVRGALTKQKIHMHMLERIKKEQRAFQRNLARQEMLVARKQGELKDALRNLQRHMQLRHNAAAAVEDVEMEADSENVLRRSSLGALKEKIQAKQDSLKRRDDFDRWRSDVAVTAAAAATAASVTQLMACAVLERVVGHSLEKKLVEQVQRAQVTEESFQKIRRATVRFTKLTKKENLPCPP